MSSSTVNSRAAEDFPALKNNLILRACRGESVERVPIWIMRQAGRYLPEYLAIRSEHSFFDVCRTASICCEVTLQPLRRFNLDAAIIFSDILVVPQALGMQVDMIAKEGPRFAHPLNVPADVKLRIDRSKQASVELKYVFDAITLTRHELDGRCPLIGFSGAPWTLMSYMIEGRRTCPTRPTLGPFVVLAGKGSETQAKAKKWLYTYVEESHDLLQLLSDFIVEYLVEQVCAGAQLLQIFESHCSCLNHDLFVRFSLPYLRQIGRGVRDGLTRRGVPCVPMIIFAKDAHYALDELCSSSFDVVGLDWSITRRQIRTLREKYPSVTLQGNLDPCALYASEQDLHKLIKQMLEVFGTKNYIANLGHGIYPDAKIDNVQHLVDKVHRISADMIKADAAPKTVHSNK
jgi:uroporphyrinogen decarboxylase